jgi:hypothetical protein
MPAWEGYLNIGYCQTDFERHAAAGILAGCGIRAVPSIDASNSSKPVGFGCAKLCQYAKSAIWTAKLTRRVGGALQAAGFIRP